MGSEMCIRDRPPGSNREEEEEEGPAGREQGQKEQQKKVRESIRPAEDDLAAIDPYPFFFIPTHLAGKLHSVTPPENPLRGALINLGYRVTRSHCKPSSIKTDAPWSVIWRVMREWARQKAPIKEENIKPGSPAYRLLRLGTQNGSSSAPPGADNQEEASGEESNEVVFDEKLGRDPTKGLYLRYQTNPRENWGPMNKAKPRRERPSQPTAT